MSSPRPTKAAPAQKAAGKDSAGRGRGSPRKRKGTDQGVVEQRSAAQIWGKTAMLGVILLWCLFPFFWLIMTSLKKGDAALNSPNLFKGPFLSLIHI